MMSWLSWFILLLLNVLMAVFAKLAHRLTETQELQIAKIVIHDA